MTILQVSFNEAVMFHRLHAFFSTSYSLRRFGGYFKIKRDVMNRYRELRNAGFDHEHARERVHQRISSDQSARHTDAHILEARFRRIREHYPHSRLLRMTLMSKAVRDLTRTQQVEVVGQRD